MDPIATHFKPGHCSRKNAFIQYDVNTIRIDA